MMDPSFAVLTAANSYWTVNEQIYSVRDRAFVDSLDPAYQAWLAQGYVAAVMSADDLRSALRDSGLPPFAKVTALQARRALRVAGLYDSVVAAVEASTDADLKDSWEYATEWHRDAAWISSVATQLNLSADQVDALFVLAAGL